MTTRGGLLPANIPSFHQFMLRAEVRALYRRVLRLSRRTRDEHRREGIRQFARHQLTAMGRVTDAPHIRHLIADGNRQCDSLETMINMTR